MKTIARIVTLSLVLSLAGALGQAWAAQSVASLVKEGETSLATFNARKADLATAVQKNHSLSTEGQQILQEQKEVEASIAAYKVKVASINAQTEQYNKECGSKDKHLTTDQFKACKATNAKLHADIAEITTEPDRLKARQAAFISKAQAYNQAVKSSPDQVKSADTAYRQALAGTEGWLDKARDLIASQAFQPFAKQARCPNVEKPATSIPGMIDMSQQVLSCLKRVASIGN